MVVRNEERKRSCRRTRSRAPTIRIADNQNTRALRVRSKKSGRHAERCVRARGRHACTHGRRSSRWRELGRHDLQRGRKRRAVHHDASRVALLLCNRRLLGPGLPFDRKCLQQVCVQHVDGHLPDWHGQLLLHCADSWAEQASVEPHGPQLHLRIQHCPGANPRARCRCDQARMHLLTQTRTSHT